MSENRRWAVEMAVKARMETEELIPVAREILEFLDGDRAAPQKGDEKPYFQVDAELREEAPSVASVEKSPRGDDLLAAAGLLAAPAPGASDRLVAMMIAHKLGAFLGDPAAAPAEIGHSEAEVLLKILKKAMSE